MDPKLSGLDPKLREAYERVMNGPTGPAGSPTPPAAANPQAPAQQTPPAPQPVQPASVNTPIAAPSPAPAHVVSSTPSFNSGNFNAAAPGGTTAVKKAGGKMSTVLIILGLIVLLIAYTFVWVYLFDLKIPFLPF